MNDFELLVGLLKTTNGFCVEFEDEQPRITICGDDCTITSVNLTDDGHDGDDVIVCFENNLSEEIDQISIKDVCFSEAEEIIEAVKNHF